MVFRKSEPGAKICSWPVNSSRLTGRIRLAKGSALDIKKSPQLPSARWSEPFQTRGCPLSGPWARLKPDSLRIGVGSIIINRRRTPQGSYRLFYL